MANRAYLVGGETAAPLGPVSDYDADSQTLCAASYQIPAFWLFCFDQPDLCVCEADGERVPTVVTSAVSARDRLDVRAALAADLFPAYSRRWAEWVRLIRDCPFPYLALDGYEVWAMAPDEFAWHLPRAVRWFTSRERSDLDSLFWLASITEYDWSRRTIACGPNESPGRFLQGYGWVRDVPWDENDPT